MKIFYALLAHLARVYLQRHQPLVVGVTGSVGKSAAKEAIILALSPFYRVRGTVGNYNNEVGVPLTILNLSGPSGAKWRWVLVLAAAIRRAYFDTQSQDSEALVLELGIDQPGDMAHLVAIAAPTVGVFLGVSESHLKSFGTLANIATEKGKLINALPEGGVAVLNYDDPLVVKTETKSGVKRVGFGDSSEATLRGTAVEFDSTLGGYRFKLEFAGSLLPVKLPHVVGRHQLESVLAAFGVVHGLGHSMVEAAKALEAFRVMPGRLSLLPGIRSAKVLDDTYNASPVSTRAALQTLAEVGGSRKIAVLGDMLELGSDSQKLHNSLADTILAVPVTTFVGIGRYMHGLHEELLRRGMDRSQNYWFESPMAAHDTVVNMLDSGDVVLVKGSQGMRLETISIDLLDPSINASEVLCRQSAGWKRKPFTHPVEWGR